MDLSKYPIETRARAALRLTAAWLEKAQTGPNGDPEKEKRRRSFLEVRRAVQAISDRCVFDPDVDGKNRSGSWSNENGEDRRPGYIEALLRIVDIKDEVFATECAAVDAGERKAWAEAEEFMAGLPKPSPQIERSPAPVPDYRPREIVVVLPERNRRRRPAWHGTNDHPEDTSRMDRAAADPTTDITDLI